MFHLLEIREKINKIYQRNKSCIVPLTKFMLAFIIFFSIGNVFGYNVMLSNILVETVLALIGAFVPLSILTLMALVMVVVQIFYLSGILAVAVAMMLVIMYCFLLRFTPKLRYLLVIVPITCLFKMPILIPLFLGVTAEISAVVPMICGVFFYYVCDSIYNMSINSTSGEIDIQKMLEVYKAFIDVLKENNEIMFSILVLGFINILVCFIRKRKIAYAYEIAIAVGGIVYMVAFLTNSFTTIGNDLSVENNVQVLLGTIVSCFVIYVIHFFDFVLDYSIVEDVQFEDDDYVYFVKAIPKMKVEVKKTDIKNITQGAIKKSRGYTKNSKNEEKNEAKDDFVKSKTKSDDIPSEKYDFEEDLSRDFGFDEFGTFREDDDVEDFDKNFDENEEENAKEKNK